MIDGARRHDFEGHDGEAAGGEGEGGGQQAEGCAGDGRAHDDGGEHGLALGGQADGALGERHAAELGGEGGDGVGLALEEEHVAGEKGLGTQALDGAAALAGEREQVEAVARAKEDVGGGAADELGVGAHGELDQGLLAGVGGLGLGLVGFFVGVGVDGFRVGGFRVGGFRLLGGLFGAHGLDELQAEAGDGVGEGLGLGLDHEDVARAQGVAGMGRGDAERVAHQADDLGVDFVQAPGELADGFTHGLAVLGHDRLGEVGAGDELLRAGALACGHEPPADQRDEDHARGGDGDARRGEVEHGEAAALGASPKAGHDEIGRRADERGHAAEDGAEGERHEHAARREFEFLRDLDGGGHEQRERAHVVHEGGEDGGDGGERGDGEGGAGGGGQQAARDGVDGPGGLQAPAQHQHARDGDDGGVAEAREGLGVGHDPGDHAGEQRAQRDHVVAPLAPDKHADGGGENREDGELVGRHEWRGEGRGARDEGRGTRAGRWRTGLRDVGGAAGEFLDVEVALRVGDLDAAGLELFPDFEVHLAAELVGAVMERLAPDAQLEVERRVAEAHETHLRLGLGQDVGALLGGGEQGGLHAADVAIVVHADRDAEADEVVVVAEVGDARGDELGVGHDDVDVVVGAHRGASGADLDHLALELVHLDAVADLDRAFHEQDEAAHEVVGDVAQAEADAEGNRAQHERQRAQVEARQHDRKDDERAQNQQDVADQGGDGDGDAGVEPGAGQEALAKQAFDDADREHECDQKDEADQHREDGDAQAAELEGPADEFKKRGHAAGWWSAGRGASGQA